MNCNQSLDILGKVEEEVWIRRIDQARKDGTLSTWVTTLLPGQASCHLASWAMKGSYNHCQKLFSEDGTAYVLRFPLVSGVSSDCADEKAAMEIEAIDLIRKKTTIPVPKVHAWGLAKANPLGLGPFILMEFIEGVYLADKFCGKELEILQEDIPDRDVEFIHRQIANFMLQLFAIDLPHIGSLPTPVTGFPAPIRPLTRKAHDILHTGGVNTFGDRTQGFSTTRKYFHHTIHQDQQQFRDQPNSVLEEEEEGESDFASLKILESMIPEMVNKDYDQGPFKLICDDFSPSNMIVRSHDDLTIVGVVDLEWVYAGPAQLFTSAPWWLLFDRPTDDNWDVVNGEPPKVATRYFKHLENFKRILDEEEGKIPESQKEVSNLVTWSEESGAMWLHMLVSNGFFGSSTFPCFQLQQNVGVEEWEEQIDEILDQEE
ncbi:hypothetical protein LT330_006791 [Penicillium expansum]|nr:hypothetical protein LT330_006791 [Penicillium expansum]